MQIIGDDFVKKVQLKQEKEELEKKLSELGRVDCIVFTGGIGENDSGVRLKACENLENLGIKIDPKLNEMRSSEIMQISTPESKVKVLVIPTNEELEIAIETLEMIEAHHTK